VWRKKEVNKTDDVYKFALELAKESYSAEEKRENSIISQAGRMVTVFSILAVFVLTVLSFLVDNATWIPLLFLTVYAIIVLSLLLGSLTLSILAQWRFKYDELPSPVRIFSHIDQDCDEYKSIRDHAENYAETMEPIYRSKLNNNNKRASFIMVAMILFYISLVVILFATINAIIIFNLR